MSTGISISSINQIKELAEQKRYAEALEILDTQNLDKSINPQFLRISGEIFRENKRYYDCRRILLKAHQMAPQGTRIIAELILMYLELGYFSLADKYYEQYKFYVAEEDTQKEFVEYIIKKAKGADIKELASILIPILERMPEDNWNYEAVLLYHKLDRKDKALDESRFILENFKDSIYTDKVIAYIDDKLDVDEEFYVFPKEEKEEDEETFGELIEQEKEILEQDYLRMYPPEPRIMVEADDNEAVDVKPVKEKKEKKKKEKKASTRKKKTEESVEDAADLTQETPAADVKADEKSETAGTDSAADEKSAAKTDSAKTEETVVGKKEDGGKTDAANATDTAEASENEEALPEIDEEERIRQEREAALETLLAKRFDAEKIKESAKQVADAVKNIDTTKAKVQVKTVTDAVVDNVKKASDVIGEAVGAKTSVEDAETDLTETKEDEFVDGIIESVLEPPKQTVGQVVMNEELDAIIPDSLEAMSSDEIADIEARKEEQERVELEALEASLKLEEERRAKRKRGLKGAEDAAEDGSVLDEAEDTASNYAELKQKFIDEFVEDDTPLDTLGFISIVHSDVDRNMEEDIPDTAQMLRQMIGNKEYYSDENSLGFESEESYRNHGFEVEDYADSKSLNVKSGFLYVQQDYNSDVYRVEDIFVDENIVSFDDIVPQVVNPFDNAFKDYSEDNIGDFLSGRKYSTAEPVSEESEDEEILLGDTADVSETEDAGVETDTVISEETEFVDITAESESDETETADIMEASVPEETEFVDVTAESESDETETADVAESSVPDETEFVDVTVESAPSETEIIDITPESEKEMLQASDTLTFEDDYVPYNNVDIEETETVKEEPFVFASDSVWEAKDEPIAFENKEEKDDVFIFASDKEEAEDEPFAFATEETEAEEKDEPFEFTTAKAEESSFDFEAEKAEEAEDEPFTFATDTVEEKEEPFVFATEPAAETEETKDEPFTFATEETEAEAAKDEPFVFAIDEAEEAPSDSAFEESAVDVIPLRTRLRLQIRISDSMTEKLLALKETR